MDRKLVALYNVTSQPRSGRRHTVHWLLHLIDPPSVGSDGVVAPTSVVSHPEMELRYQIVALAEKQPNKLRQQVTASVAGCIFAEDA